MVALLNARAPREALRLVHGPDATLAHLLIEHIAAVCNVSASTYDDARQHYGAVGAWLAADEGQLGRYSPEVYAQGSTALQTLVRPDASGAYDVDAVCVLRYATDKLPPEDLKALVGERLRAHATYAAMLKEGRRCWTLEYADGSRFHLDVLPAVPSRDYVSEHLGVAANLTEHALRITDTNEPGRWLKSNPRGFAAWFRDRSQVQRGLVEQLRKAGIVVPLPDYSVGASPLQGVVRILKRHRDVMFGGDRDRPISTIITTLAAKAYNGTASTFDALLLVMGELKRVLRDHEGVVSNPVDPNEVFTDKWKNAPRKAELFQGWVERIDALCRDLRATTSIDRVARLLASALGDDLVSDSMADFEAHPAATLRKAPTLTETGTLASPREEPIYKQDTPWLMVLDHTANMTAVIDGTIRYSGAHLRRHTPLRFQVTTSLPEPFEVYWQVVNTGAEAARRWQLRGTIEASGTWGTGGRIQTETASYEGTHTIEAFVVTGDGCRARTGPFEVRVG